MSLVAYAASSDEDSDCETTDESNTIIASTPSQSSTVVEHQQSGLKGIKSLTLPQPKHVVSDKDEDDGSKDDTDSTEFKINLPKPKKLQNALVEEEDDEFLHKKVQPSLIEKPTKPKPGIRQPVKITIPSLSELGPAEVAPNGKTFSLGPKPQKSSGLLNVLPPPKFNGIFGKPKEKQGSTTTTTTSTTDRAPITKTTSLIPHSVSKKQAAAKAKSPAEKKSIGLNHNNSDDSDNEDDECGDFFSLNTEVKLPEVSAAEIDAMVAKKANKMAEFSRNLNEVEKCTPEVQEFAHVSTSNVHHDRDEINIEALIGARAAKRSRKEDIQFIDISQDQVTFSHDEWSRNQLQSETQFQPTGRLNVGEGPGTGTKKKHQITYLAHQAKANEAELQAMWATNRQSRRQTQSKYGF